MPSVLEGYRLADIDRALFRRVVKKALVHGGPRLKIVMR